MANVDAWEVALVARASAASEGGGKVPVSALIYSAAESISVWALDWASENERQAWFRAKISIASSSITRCWAGVMRQWIVGGAEVCCGCAARAPASAARRSAVSRASRI